MNTLNLTIVHEDGSMSRLNSRLVEKQGLDQDRVDILKALHQEKWRVFEMMKKTNDSKELKDLAH